GPGSILLSGPIGMSISWEKFRLKYPKESIKVPVSSWNEPSNTGATSSPLAWCNPSFGRISPDRSCPARTHPDAAMHTAVAPARAHLPNRDPTASMSTLYSLPTGVRPAGTFGGTIIMDLGPNLDASWRLSPPLRHPFQTWFVLSD